MDRADKYRDSRVRLRVKTFVDEVENIGLNETKAFFEKVNAELTLELIRMPRENVRSERILELEGLFEKIQENAEILSEAIPPGVKAKAQRLEEGDVEAMLEEIREL